MEARRRADGAWIFCLWRTAKECPDVTKAGLAKAGLVDIGGQRDFDLLESKN
jgi:hypothetical protein